MNHKRLFIVPLILSFFLTGCLAPQVEENTNTNNNNTQQNGNNNQNGGETNNNNNTDNGSETGNESGNDNGTTGTGDNNGQGNTGGDNNQGGTGNESGNTGNGNTGGDTGNTGNTGGDNGQGNTGGNSGNTGGDSGNTNTGGENTNGGNTSGDSGNTNTGVDVTAEGDGTQAHPYNVSQAYAIIDALKSGKNNGKVVYVIGVVTTEDGDIHHGTYGSNFYITDGSKTIYAYSISGVSETEGDPKYVAEGYTVVVSGALIKYSKTKYEVGYASNSLNSNLVSSTPGTGNSSSSGGNNNSNSPANYTLYQGQTWTQTTDNKSWTIMIYMCGADLESDNGLASADINEILSVNGQPSNVNIVLETGGCLEWKTSNIPNDKLGRFHVSNGQLIKDAELEDASMGLQSTFESFLTWGLTYYPADKVGLIMWNHGGAMDGVCFDENHGNDPLTNKEVNAALTSVKQSLNKTEKFEFIGYDACLMQVQDIADYNADHFNYMVGAQESEAGEGWEYNTWIDDVYAKKDTKTILKAICDGFISSFDTNYGNQYDNDQTQSFLDLSKAPAYKTAFNNLASSLSSVIPTKNFTTFMKGIKDYADSYMTKKEYQEALSNGYTSDMFYTVKENGQTYYVLPGYYSYGSFDVYDFFQNLKTQTLFTIDTTKVDAAIQAFENYVVYSKVGGEAGHSNGLCVICAMDSYFVQQNYYPANETAFTIWRNLVMSSSRNF